MDFPVCGYGCGEQLAKVIDSFMKVKKCGGESFLQEGLRRAESPHLLILRVFLLLFRGDLNSGH